MGSGVLSTVILTEVSEANATPIVCHCISARRPSSEPLTWRRQGYDYVHHGVVLVRGRSAHKGPWIQSRVLNSHQLWAFSTSYMFRHFLWGINELTAVDKCEKSFILSHFSFGLCSPALLQGSTILYFCQYTLKCTATFKKVARYYIYI